MIISILIYLLSFLLCLCMEFLVGFLGFSLYIYFFKFIYFNRIEHLLSHRYLYSLTVIMYISSAYIKNLIRKYHNLFSSQHKDKTFDIIPKDSESLFFFFFKSFFHLFSQPDSFNFSIFNE